MASRFHHSGVLIEAWSIAELPKPRCHLFHLFYQVQIRLGSPRGSHCFRCCLQLNNSHCVTSSAHPAPRIAAFPKFMRR
jgi:hypothetical protein